MKCAFLDTNVLIDFLADRRPFSLAAAKLFNFSLSGKLRIYICAVSYNNIYYILRQSAPHKETMRLLSELNEMSEILDVTGKIINESLISDFNDFEDAIQYNSARAMGKIELIITRNTKDFKKSALPILTPKEAVSMLESTLVDKK